MQEELCVCVCVCVCVCPHLRLRAFVSLAMCVTGTEQVDKGGCKANSGAVLLPLLSCSPFHSSHAHTHTCARAHIHTQVGVSGLSHIGSFRAAEITSPEAPGWAELPRSSRKLLPKRPKRDWGAGTTGSGLAEPERRRRD